MIRLSLISTAAWSFWKTHPWSRAAFVNHLDPCWGATGRGSEQGHQSFQTLQLRRQTCEWSLPAPLGPAASWMQLRRPRWPGAELKSCPAKLCLCSWPTASWEINCCLKLLGFDMIWGSDRNTLHNEHSELLKPRILWLSKQSKKRLRGTLT